MAAKLLSNRRRRLVAVLLLIAVALALLLLARVILRVPPGLPNTSEGIHLEMAFDYRYHGRAPGVDAIWAASPPLKPHHYDTLYLHFDTSQSATSPVGYEPLRWWQQNHPTWIEYTCAGRPAYEFSEMDTIPLDTANPDVRQWQWQHEVRPALRMGYQGIAFDNLNLNNKEGERCGHHSSAGTWVNQFSGAQGLPNYQQAVISWVQYMRRRLHSVGRSLGINYSYETDVPLRANLQLMELPDLLFDEQGVTQGGEFNNMASAARWGAFFFTAELIQSRGVCYHLNGEEPQDTNAIPLAEREWIIANYLLIKGSCTFTYITGYRAYAAATRYAQPVPGRDQDYGIYHMFPEYKLPVGHPLSPAEPHNGLWARRYSGGLVLVNPYDASASFTSPQPLYALGQSSLASTFTLQPHTALILLPSPGE